MPNIALDDIINVQVSAAARPAVRQGYNVGLIMGQSTRIPQSVRCVEFASTAAMLEYGFQVTDPEYLAAEKYFGQSMVPSKVVVGIMCPANVSQTASATVSGTGITAASVTASTFSEAVGDKNGTYEFVYGTVWSLNGKAIGNTAALTAAYGITVTGTAQSGCKVTVTYVSAAVLETWAQAIASAKDVNNDWYGVYVAYYDSVTPARLGAEDHAAIAAYVDTIKAMYFFDDGEDDDKGTATTDIFSTLMGAEYERYCGLYSSTLYAGAAVMGYAMGANTGEVNSAYTMTYKPLYGVTPNDLTVTEINNLKAKNANYYIKRGGVYTTFEPGVAGCDGRWVDEIIGIDQLTRDLQIACMSLLTSVPKVPYTDAGVLQFIVACNQVCDDAVRTGFLTAGVWNGNAVLNLNKGDMLDAGYVVQAETVVSQTPEMKASRVCPPLYVCAILAGAIHSVVIKLDVE